MNKKIVAGVIVVLLILVGILAVVNRGNSADKPGMVITAGDKEVSVAWEDIGEQVFEGNLVNGKGETSQHSYTGAGLINILSDNGIEITEDSKITVTAEDNYSAELTGAEILEPGKVFVAVTADGEMIEGIEGGQGAQLIVFGDPNSKRAVQYLKTIDIK